MKYTLSPIKWQTITDNQRTPHNAILFDLSPNLIHTLGKCKQRYCLSQRLRITAIDGQSCEQLRRRVEELDDFSPDNSRQFATYLDLISTEELKDKPLSRLQSRHPLRHISRVRLRPKSGHKVAINSMELSSVLRRVCLKSVESLKQSDIESKVEESEVFCNNNDINIVFDHNLDQNQSQRDKCFAKKSLFNCKDTEEEVKEDTNECAVNSELNECSVLIPRLNVCPNCGDILFNRSRKNSLKQRYHSCLKGRVNNEITDNLKNFCL